MASPALARRFAALRTSTDAPLAILDIDLTLVDNAPRNRAIWGDWLHSVRAQWAGAEEAKVRAQVMPIVFGVRENLATLGVNEPGLVRDALRFWLDAFFSDRYLGYDTAMPGAVDAVKRLRSEGLTVVYLTARPQRMLTGTVRRFAELGLPLGEPGTVLTMKPDSATDDGAFKREALEWIATLGSPILCADNEPGHVNAMHARFPDALSLLLDSRHHAGAPPLSTGLSAVSSLSVLWE